MAFSASCRASCPRAHVGCSLFDKDKIVVATGYNGVPSGQPQCDEVGCVMVDGHCSLTVHAEKNAKKFAKKRGVKSLPGGFGFVTIRPCIKCFEELREFRIKHMLYLNEYNNQDDCDYIEKICRRERIEFRELPFNLTDLLKKALEFHKGPGGILVRHPWLSITDLTPA